MARKKTTIDKIETAEGWMNGVGGLIEKVVKYPMEQLKGREKYLEELADAMWNADNVKGEKGVVKRIEKSRKRNKCIKRRQIR
ncbi:MAG: hypothetical protein IPG38_18340 [Chitinophagaceae bacterium]|nr:hypothetical protein [Chitinophagaceae bacterium]